MSEPTTAAVNNKSFAACNSCGGKNPEYAQFCYSCGAQQAQTVALSSTAARALAAPVYSGVLLRLMLIVFLLAVAAFDACQAATQDGSYSNFLRPALIGLSALGLIIISRGSWARTFGPTTVGERARDKRRIATVTATVATLSLCTAILLGWLIGSSRKQLKVLNVDLAQYAEIEGRISKARNEVEGRIPDYVRMYESIEPDVIALQTCSSRLVGELGSYDTEFPEYHVQTAKSIANVSGTERRMALLMKQIGIAKKVKTMESDEQRTVWLSELLPLAQEEDNLEANTAH